MNDVMMLVKIDILKQQLKQKIMEKFSVFVQDKEYEFEYPTSIEELDTDWLKEVTSNITPADHYSVIALVYKESLNAVVTTYKQKKKGLTSSVIPVFVKCGNTDSAFIKSINTKDMLIIQPNMLQLASHLTVPANTLSIDTLTNFLDGDRDAFTRTLGHRNKVCFVEFKLIANNDIIAAGINKGNIKMKYLTVRSLEEKEEDKQ